VAILLTLERADLDVEPGSVATCLVTVRNASEVVDELAFEVVGVDPSWASFEPATVSLMPGTEGSVQLLLRPPRSPQVRAGARTMGVKASSGEDPAASVVEEAVLRVGSFSEAVGELVPRTSRGRRGAAHELRIENRGNSALDATLSARDPDELLHLDVAPPELVADPGQAAFARVAARPRRPFWRGPAKTIGFQVLVEPRGQASVAVDGSMVQEAIIPAWAPRVAAGALAALAALVVLWLTVLRPAVVSSAEDAAQDALEEPLAGVAGQVAEVAERTGALEEQVTGSSLPPPSPTTTLVGAADGLGTPTVARLEIEGEATADSFTPPAGQVVSITDLVLQNPAGDTGTLLVQRGSDELLEFRLENFRDLDYHFLAPLVLAPGQTLQLRVRCENPSGPCSPAMTFTGFTRPAG